MIPTITVFEWVPDFARGYVRDMRARWAFEETGQDYAVDVIDFDRVKSPAHRRFQPFGQVPSYRDDAVEIFESGAIALHIARAAPGLLPADPAGQARAEQWVIAALNSVEPYVMQLAVVDIFEADRAWSAERRPKVIEDIRGRLVDLSAALGDKDWLDNSFTVGDLTMVCVLRGLHDSRLLEEFPNLAAYVARGEARPAYARALAAHLADFAAEPVAA
ncbi:glutathione S-transferase family protein [Sphingomonas endolithica]|uniref:glutathione S-transferase family protein n=1 Tax=Sphingomonas endolithica TaxID=2972485 RepID=UPI0021AFF9AA|nr:glutathione S-transferase family protein [Sphingomonas sp. ZFBP2030]